MSIANLWFTSRIHLVEFSLKPAYPTMVGENYMVFRLLKNTFVSQKNLICSFILIPPSKTFPQVLITTPQVEENYPFPSNNALSKSIFPAESGRTIMKLIKWPKLNLRGYWSLILKNSTIFATFLFLVSVLLCHDLGSSMLRCEASLT